MINCLQACSLFSDLRYLTSFWIVTFLCNEPNQKIKKNIICQHSTYIKLSIMTVSSQCLLLQGMRQSGCSGCTSPQIFGTSPFAPADFEASSTMCTRCFETRMHLHPQVQIPNAFPELSFESFGNLSNPERKMDVQTPIRPCQIDQLNLMLNHAQVIQLFFFFSFCFTILTKLASYRTVGFWSLEIGKKVLHSFDNVFHVYLMNGLQKYKKKISRWLFEIIHIIRFEMRMDSWINLKIFLGYDINYLSI